MLRLFVVCIVCLTLTSQSIQADRIIRRFNLAAQSGPSQGSPAGGRRLLTASNEPSSGQEELITNTWVVVLKRGAAQDVAAATARLVQHVRLARAALPRAAAAGAAAASSSSSDEESDFSVLSSLQRPPNQAPQAGAAAAAAAAGPGASSGSSSGSVQGLVVKAAAHVAQQLRSADDVAYVFADRVMSSQVEGLAGDTPDAAAATAAAAAAAATADQAAATGAVEPPLASTARRTSCVGAAALSQGSITSRALNPNFKWPGCYTPRARLVWMASRCGDMSGIQYTAVLALNRTTGAVLRLRGQDCILRFDSSKPVWSQQRFGGCGTAATWAPDLPTATCSATSASAAASCLPVPADPAAAVTADVRLSSEIKCGSGTASRLRYSGIRCGPDNAFVQWRSATGPGGCVVLNPVPASSQGSGLGSNGVDRFQRFANDVFGSCGVPPGKAEPVPSAILCADPKPPQDPKPQPSPNPDPQTLEPSPSPSPSPNPAAPTAYSGPRLPRVPVAAGEQVPAGLSRIEAVTAEGVASTAGLPTGQQVVVGVIDSGVEATHPDMTYAGGRSWLDANASTGAEDAPDTDAYGHGTHVAGIITALNSNADPAVESVVGISPGTPVFSLKILDAKGRGAMSNMLAAVQWVMAEGLAQGIRVINLSLAAYVNPGSPDYQAVFDAVCGVMKDANDAGIFVAVAAGNYGDDIKGYFPAACPTVVAVTAMDPAGNEPASFSNFLQADSSDADKARVVAAPGVNIKSTTSYTRDASGYKVLSGTSQATPHVAAIAANCILSGACTGKTGLDNLATILAAAQLRAASTVSGSPQYGFSSDASSTINGKYRGLLVWSAF